MDHKIEQAAYELLVKEGKEATQEVVEKIRKELKIYVKQLVTELNVTKDFASTVANSDEMFMMPRGTKYIDKSEHGTSIVIEFPPSIRTLCFQNPRAKRQNIRISLPFPHVIFVVTVNSNGSYADSRTVLVDKPLKSLQDIVYEIPLPNNMGGGCFCLGKAAMTELRQCTNVIDICHKSVEVFWKTKFEGIVDGVYGNISITKWSQIEPHEITGSKIGWYPRSLKELLANAREIRGRKKNVTAVDKEFANVVDNFSDSLGANLTKIIGRNRRPKKPTRNKVTRLTQKLKDVK